MTPTEREQLRVAHAAMLEADQKARERGLSRNDIKAEVEDDDSQYWDDFTAAATRAREDRSHH
jgi:hypothetical protein